MSEALGQPGEALQPHPMRVGAIRTTAFRLYERHWQRLLPIAAVVVVPLTLLQYWLGYRVRLQGQAASDVMASPTSWRAGGAGLLTGIAGLLMYLVLTGAITRAVAAEAAGEDPSVEQSYRF